MYNYQIKIRNNVQNAMVDVIISSKKAIDENALESLSKTRLNDARKIVSTYGGTIFVKQQ